jgi:hypothetical protein
MTRMMRMMAAVATWHGTHPPAGTHLMGRTMHVFRIANERIIEEWSTGWDWTAPHTRTSAPQSPNPLAGT